MRDTLRRRYFLAAPAFAGLLLSSGCPAPLRVRAYSYVPVEDYSAETLRAGGPALLPPQAGEGQGEAQLAGFADSLDMVLRLALPELKLVGSKASLDSLRRDDRPAEYDSLVASMRRSGNPDAGGIQRMRSSLGVRYARYCELSDVSQQYDRTLFEGGVSSKGGCILCRIFDLQTGTLAQRLFVSGGAAARSADLQRTPGDDAYSHEFARAIVSRLPGASVPEERDLEDNGHWPP